MKKTVLRGILLSLLLALAAAGFLLYRAQSRLEGLQAQADSLLEQKNYGAAMTAYGQLLQRTPLSFFSGDRPFVIRGAAGVLSCGTALLDLGCGAGFPSLVLAAAFPEVFLTSVDSTLKKINFVQSAAEKLALGNLKAVHGRGNELARKPPFKGRYDAVFARAVASADILIREGLSFLKPGGSLIVYRTREQYGSELDFLKKWKKGSFRSTELFDLPDQTGTRMFLQIKSCSQHSLKN